MHFLILIHIQKLLYNFAIKCFTQTLKYLTCKRPPTFLNGPRPDRRLTKTIRSQCGQGQQTGAEDANQEIRSHTGQGIQNLDDIITDHLEQMKKVQQQKCRFDHEIDRVEYAEEDE